MAESGCGTFGQKDVSVLSEYGKALLVGTADSAYHLL